MAVVEPDAQDQDALLLNPDAQHSSTKRSRVVAGVGAALLVGAGFMAAVGLTARTSAPSQVQPTSDLGITEFVEVTFDCEAGQKYWQQGWSALKQKWCCDNKKVGCKVDSATNSSGAMALFNCTAGFSNWDAGWSSEKKNWCCAKEAKGCHSNSELKVTFVVSQVPYKTLKASPYLPQEFAESTKRAIATATVHCAVSPKEIQLRFWEGSALHATTEDRASGVVVRATIGLTEPDSWECVKKTLESPEFKEAAAVSTGNHLMSIASGIVGVHDVTVDERTLTPCSCPHGVAAEGAQCPSGGHVCTSCEAGHHMTNLHQCEVNICKCHGGQAARGELCESHEETKCVSCFIGWHFHAGEKGCKPNECLCDQGFPATGPNCLQNHAAICGSCYPGLYVDKETKECVTKQCTCDNGVAVDAEQCFEDGKEQCKECNAGYHLDELTNKCVVNECYCKDGEKAVGTNCHTHGENVCAFCYNGFYLFHHHCTSKKECHCPNGFAVTGEACTTNNAIMCDKCQTGYTLMEGQCVENKCSCHNGEAKVEAKCDAHGLVECESCNDGYFLSEGQCKKKECTCANGVGAQGKNCAHNGVESCASCDNGYHSSLYTTQDLTGMTRLAVKCMPNRCTCEFDGLEAGIAAKDAHQDKCYADGANVCVTCFKNHDPTRNCKPNQCYCTNGTPVDVTKCAVDNDHNCETCKPGFWKASEDDKDFVLNADYSDQQVKEKSVAYWNRGNSLCLADVATTAEAFDCQAALLNFELAWSERKKFWCCQNKGLGCKAQLTAKSACEDKGFNEAQCAAVGCCAFQTATGECKAKVTLENEICQPGFKIIARSTNQCLAEVQAAGASPTDPKVATLKTCQLDDGEEDWRPNQYEQIHDSAGNCLSVDKVEAGVVLKVARCSTTASGPEYALQHFKYYDQSTPKVFKIRAPSNELFCVQVTPCEATAPATCITQLVLQPCNLQMTQAFDVAVM